ncbi:hypothetical protein ACFVT5_32825 [Streptomyces sp. NPDC058001]|uniref:hypothetical protein n=1 Tax=Streptomyces sp. NPDC058001 TaxID=3346300 RepID=UPI0036EE1B86
MARISLTPPRTLFHRAVEWYSKAAERLCEQLGEPAFVELTAMVAVENLRSGMNSVLGLTSQGFKDSCEVSPPAARKAPDGADSATRADAPGGGALESL